MDLKKLLHKNVVSSEASKLFTAFIASIASSYSSSSRTSARASLRLSHEI
jgi:hypothetical protein